MALILAFDTSTKGCSAALFNQEKCIAHTQIIEDGFVHSEQLHLIVDDLFKSNHLGFADLDAIAIGAGPGSYTGLRIGISSAKGYAFALEKPLIAIDSLELLAVSAQTQLKKDQLEKTLIFSAIDARRQEVYARIQTGSEKLIVPSQALLLEEIDIQSVFGSYERVCVIGDATEKLNLFFSKYKDLYVFEFIHAFPDALYMGKMALERFLARDFVSTEYFEPNYIKEVHITAPKKQP